MPTVREFELTAKLHLNDDAGLPVVQSFGGPLLDAPPAPSGADAAPAEAAKAIDPATILTIFQLAATLFGALRGLFGKKAALLLAVGVSLALLAGDASACGRRSRGCQPAATSRYQPAVYPTSFYRAAPACSGGGCAVGQPCSPATGCGPTGCGVPGGATFFPQAVPAGGFFQDCPGGRCPAPR